MAAASSSFLLQALQKTSSFLSIPLPTLALAPVKQETEAQSASSGLPRLESKMSLTSMSTSPVATRDAGDGVDCDGANKRGMTKKASGVGILSERHKKVIADASPGVGTPVIYVPQTARSEVSNTPVYSSAASMTGMLEVGSFKSSRFKPSSLKHLDLSQVAEASTQAPTSTMSFDVSDMGPNAPIKDLDETWAACWDDEAGAVYYYNKESGEATWLAPKRGGGSQSIVEDEEGEGGEDGLGKGEQDFFQLINKGLPKGLGEFNFGDSELTIKTRKIAARQKLWVKLRNRYEGDRETEYSSALKEKEQKHYSKLEDSEVMWEYTKELTGWFVQDET